MHNNSYKVNASLAYIWKEMPRRTDRNNSKFNLRNAFGVGSSRTQSEVNKLANAPKSIYPALALAVGRYTQFAHDI